MSDLAGEPRAEVPKGDACTPSPVENGDMTGRTELHLARYEIDFYACSPLKIEGRRFDEASREAEVKNSSLKSNAPWGMKTSA